MPCLTCVPVYWPGMTGNVLINDNANRLSQYYVWSYGPGNESYYKIMYIDFAAAQDKVARQAVILPRFLSSSRCDVFLPVFIQLLFLFRYLAIWGPVLANYVSLQLYDSTSIRRSFDCLLKVIKVTVTQPASRSHAGLFINVSGSTTARTQIGLRSSNGRSAV